MENNNYSKSTTEIWMKKNESLHESFDFRTIRQEEAEESVEIEQICFPPNEACSREHMIERIAAASELFLVAEDRRTGKIAGFLNGIATDENCFRDDFFTDARNHKKDGKNVMLLGLDVLPEYQKQGLAKEIMRALLADADEMELSVIELKATEAGERLYREAGFEDDSSHYRHMHRRNRNTE